MLPMCNLHQDCVTETEEDKSLMHIRNSKGPSNRKDPCGRTPYLKNAKILSLKRGSQCLQVRKPLTYCVGLGKEQPASVD